MSAATFVDMTRVEPTIVEKDAQTEHDARLIEDQILVMAFGKVMRGIRRRTLLLAFSVGMLVGMLLLGAVIAILISMAGAQIDA